MELVPQQTQAIVSPFMGGGVVEVNFAYNFGIPVYAYDLYSPLVNFWKQYLDNPSTLMWRVKQILEHHSKEVYHKRESLSNSFANIRKIKSLREMAAMYYLWNKLGHCGKVIEDWKPYVADFDFDLDGKPYRIRGTQYLAIVSQQILDFYEKYHRLLKVNVGCCDFATALERHPDCLAFCDPPYPVDHRLYQHEFSEDDHRRLAETLKTHEDWILCYNEHPLIRELYDDYPSIVIDKHSGIANKWGREQIIFSHSVAEKHRLEDQMQLF